MKEEEEEEAVFISVVNTNEEIRPTRIRRNTAPFKPQVR